MPEDGDKKVTLSKANTYVPLGLLCSIVASALWLQSWITQRFDDQQTYMAENFRRAEEQAQKLEQRVYAIELINHNRWDSLDMKEWALELRSMNPELQVPTVKDN
jgi:hypothetical protein